MSSKAATGHEGSSRPLRPVIGLEAEFSTFVRDEKRLPEHVFRHPSEIVRGAMLPRSGRSAHMPSGGALYFDTGVIEVATPIIEIEPGCCIRATRSLWEQIAYLRRELDGWEKRDGRKVRLEGFSAHYNISVPPRQGLAHLLSFILPVPVLLLAANRLSTGVGVRPRENRVEVTVDFTPDPDLMIAAASLIAGVVTAVAEWPSHDLGRLARFPVITPFQPGKHTSRKGWLARFDCFPRNPFAADVNAPDWRLRDGRTLSLRRIAREIAEPFRDSILAVSDADCLAHIFEVFDGRARSLLDFPERPPRYQDVGRVIDWNRRSIRKLPRSAYEEVVHRIITHRKMRVGASTYVAERMQGWYEVVSRNTKTGLRRVFNLDDLVAQGGV